jgi:hypothetical protein
MARHYHDDLLDEPLLSPNELKSYLSDLNAKKESQIPDPDYWERVKGEMVRRQVNRQIKIANSVRCATWALVLFSASVFFATIVQVVVAIKFHGK